MDIIELKNKRAGLVTQMRSLLDTAAKAGRNLTADEETKYEAIQADVDGLGKTIARAENLASFEASLSAHRDSTYRPGIGGDEDAAPRAGGDYKKAFFGKDGFLRKQGIVTSLSPNIFNVLQTGVDVDGGYLVPETYESEIMKLLYSADPIRAAATVMTLGTTANIPVQTAGVSFGWVGENGAFGAVSPKVGRVILGAHKLGGYIPVSTEMLQDSGSNVEGFVRDVGVQAIADLEEAAFTTGSGAAQPEGLFTATSVAGVTIQGVTGAASATAAITGDNLIDVFHTLTRPYRQNSSWLMSDAAVKLVRKLKNTVTGDYIWQPGLQAGQPDRILNRPVLVSEHATAPAVSTKSIVFGDLRKYYIADRIGISMQRLNELGALNGQVYFLMAKRTDGRLTDAKAVVTFTHGAAN
jgi:HK97 family phage major capsid protein